MKIIIKANRVGVEMRRVLFAKKRLREKLIQSRVIYFNDVGTSVHKHSLLSYLLNLKISKQYLISFGNTKEEKNFFNNFGDVIHLHHALNNNLLFFCIMLDLWKSE